MADEIQASHILLMHEGSQSTTQTRSKEEAMAEVQAIAAELEGGADFAELARARSDCPSGQDGGDLGAFGRGAFGRGAMVPEFDAAAFALEVGALSDIFETGFGYHIVKRTK